MSEIAILRVLGATARKLAEEIPSQLARLVKWWLRWVWGRGLGGAVVWIAVTVLALYWGGSWLLGPDTGRSLAGSVGVLLALYAVFAVMLLPRRD